MKDWLTALGWAVAIAACGFILYGVLMGVAKGIDRNDLCFERGGIMDSVGRCVQEIKL